MKTCKQIQHLLYPYLDGELGAAENREVEEHALVCQRCNDILKEQRRFLALLNTTALLEKGPDALREKILRQTKPAGAFRQALFEALTRRRVAGFAFAAAMAVLVMIALPTRGPAPQPFIQSALTRHQEFLRGALPLEIKSGDPEVVSRWLKDQIGIDQPFPAFDDSNVVLVGGGVYRHKGQDVGLVSYKVHDVPVTLVVTRGSPETDIETRSYSFVGDRRVNFTTADGLNVVSWSVCSNNFALVSSLPQRGKEGCTVCHGNGSGLIDLSEFYAKT